MKVHNILLLTHNNKNAKNGLSICLFQLISETARPILYRLSLKDFEEIDVTGSNLANFI